MEQQKRWVRGSCRQAAEEAATAGSASLEYGIGLEPVSASRRWELHVIPKSRGGAETLERAITKQQKKKAPQPFAVRLFSLQGWDSNPQSPGYEPDEIPFLHPASYCYNKYNIFFSKVKKNFLKFFLFFLTLRPRIRISLVSPPPLQLLLDLMVNLPRP